MQLEEFYGCCGIGILCGLNSPFEENDDRYGYEFDGDDHIFMDDTRPQIDDPLGFYKAFAAAKDSNYGFLFATTTAGQKTAIKELARFGFRKLFTFKNPNTAGTEVTIWCRALSKGLERIQGMEEILRETASTIIAVDAEADKRKKERKAAAKKARKAA